MMEIPIPAIYLYCSLAIAVIITIILTIRKSMADGLESGLIKIMPEISASLKAGYSLEMILNSIAMKPHQGVSGQFNKIVQLMNKGMKAEEAVASVSKANGNTTFMLLSDILAASLNTRVLATNLDNLSKRLIDVERQSDWINDKVKASLLTLQFSGILVIPIIFYMVVSTISTVDTVVSVDTNLQIFFIAITVILSSLNFIIFKDMIGTICTFLLGSSTVLLIITVFGPLVGKLFAVS